MGLKRGLDQTSAWILSLILAGIIFGAGYLLTRAQARDSAEPLPEAPAAGVAGAAAAQEHGEAGAPGPEAAAVAAPEAAKAEPPAPAPGGAEVHWEYRGSAGPDHWGELSDAYKTCAAGKRQSPVDIDGPPTDRQLLPIRFTYKEGDFIEQNTGHTLALTAPHGDFVEIDGERYDLAQIDFHAPSEHKIAGAPYDFELHLVHKSAGGKLAVIAILFEEGAANAAIAKLWRDMPGPGETRPEPLTFDPASLLPKRRVYYHYEGSLTSPPCTEGVAWYVLAQAETLASKQVDAFTHFVPFNARPVQPLAGRRVIKSAR